MNGDAGRVVTAATDTHWGDFVPVGTIQGRVRGTFSQSLSIGCEVEAIFMVSPTFRSDSEIKQLYCQ